MMRCVRECSAFTELVLYMLKKCRCQLQLENKNKTYLWSLWLWMDGKKGN